MKATLDDQGRQKQIFESEFLMSGLLLNIIWTFLLNLFNFSQFQVVFSELLYVTYNKTLETE